MRIIPVLSRNVSPSSPNAVLSLDLPRTSRAVQLVCLKTVTHGALLNLKLSPAHFSLARQNNLQQQQMSTERSISRGREAVTYVSPFDAGWRFILLTQGHL